MSEFRAFLLEAILSRTLQAAEAPKIPLAKVEPGIIFTKIYSMKIYPLAGKSLVLTALITIGATFMVSAQMPGQGPSGMTAAMSKLFGDVKAFSARADVQVLDSSQKEMVSMPMDFAFLDGKMRVELDMGQMKNSSMPPGAADQLKQMGMSQVISIVRPDKQIVYVAYPNSKAAMSMPLPKDESGSEKNAKLQKTELGKETVDGHACVKNKVVIPDPKGQSIEATTWNATDLKDFPVKVETTDPQKNTSIIRFSKIQFTKPDAKQFEVPEGYTQYSSPQEMMQAMMSKMMPKQDGTK